MTSFDVPPLTLTLSPEYEGEGTKENDRSVPERSFNSDS
jgi:hypothetical protein